jgi:hypothetical protein
MSVKLKVQTIIELDLDSKILCTVTTILFQMNLNVWTSLTWREGYSCVSKFGNSWKRRLQKAAGAQLEV